jgi:diguanylate cyclase (GGDEF)-like protein
METTFAPERRDPLTALLSQHAFRAALEAEVGRATRYDRGLTLVLFDVVGLAEINTTLGTDEGDRLLRLVADTAVSTLRASDTAGRLGGDEFGALLLETGVHGGYRFLGRLRELLPAGVEVSAGCSQFPCDGSSAADLLRVASLRPHTVEDLHEAVG